MRVLYFYYMDHGGYDIDFWENMNRVSTYCEEIIGYYWEFLSGQDKGYKGVDTTWSPRSLDVWRMF